MSVQATLTDSSGEVIRASVKKGQSILITARHSWTATGAGSAKIQRSKDGGQNFVDVALSRIVPEAQETDAENWTHICWNSDDDYIYRVWFDVETLEPGDGTVCVGTISLSGEAAEKTVFAAIATDANADLDTTDIIRFDTEVSKVGHKVILDTLTEYATGFTSLTKGMVVVAPGRYSVSVGAGHVMFSAAVGTAVFVLTDAVTNYAASISSTPDSDSAAKRSGQTSCRRVFEIQNPAILMYAINSETALDSVGYLNLLNPELVIVEL